MDQKSRRLIGKGNLPVYTSLKEVHGDSGQGKIKSYENLLLNSCVRGAFLTSCGFDCDKHLNQNIKPGLINGVVLGKKKSENGCFGTITYKLKNQLYILEDLCYCVSDDQDLWEYIVPGDSLCKGENKLTVEVYRDGVGRQFTYPCCSK